MPRDFVFVNRIQWGVLSVLAHLGARANFHRIERELRFDKPPSTELGHADADPRPQRVAQADRGEGRVARTGRVELAQLDLDLGHAGQRSPMARTISSASPSSRRKGAGSPISSKIAQTS